LQKPYAQAAMTTLTPALTAAIEALYVTFKRPHPSRVDGCPCCWKDKENQALMVTPPREMTPDQLSRYSAKVFTTVGGLSDYKYFLPRIFELTAAESGWPDTEIVLGKLKLAEWQYWPKEEHRAVQTFVDAWFEAEALAVKPSDDEYYHSRIDELICGIAKTGIGLEPYLNRLLDHPLALADFYYSNAEMLSDKDRLSNAFWEDIDPVVVAGVKAFLRSDVVLDALTR
jgi:hypothetical protein